MKKEKRKKKDEKTNVPLACRLKLERWINYLRRGTSLAGIGCMVRAHMKTVGFPDFSIFHFFSYFADQLEKEWKKNKKGVFIGIRAVFFILSLSTVCVNV